MLLALGAHHWKAQGAHTRGAMTLLPVLEFTQECSLCLVALENIQVAEHSQKIVPRLGLWIPGCKLWFSCASLNGPLQKREGTAEAGAWVRLCYGLWAPVALGFSISGSHPSIGRETKQLHPSATASLCHLLIALPKNPSLLQGRPGSKFMAQGHPGPAGRTGAAVPHYVTCVGGPSSSRLSERLVSSWALLASL